MAEDNVNPALLGRVVVVAGSHPAFPDAVRVLVEAGAFVAFISPAGGGSVAHAGFRADPAEPGVWDRVAPHVEQRLGPVDLVVGDPETVPLLETVFRPDLQRRGHGEVIAVEPEVTVDQLVSRLVDTP